MRSTFTTIALTTFLLGSSVLLLQGEEASWVTDLSLAQADGSQPPWLKKLPAEQHSTTLSEIRFEIIPPATASDLLITVSFNEIPGGFLKIFWHSFEGAKTLSDNFYEGIEMPNRRSLLIPHLTPGERGVLTFQCSQQDPNISRIHWEWLDPKAISVTGAGSDVAVLSAKGRILTESDVGGDPAPIPADAWAGSVITAPLLDQPERIEQGVEFEVHLDDVPKLARLQTQMAGLPIDKNLTIWINGRISAPVALEAPDLTDAGYQSNASGKIVYTGWRKVQFLVPENWLQKGSNKLQFSWGDESGTTYPVALKELALQLNFLKSPPNLSMSPVAAAEMEPILDPLPEP